jgi:flagellin-like protein
LRASGRRSRRRLGFRSHRRGVSEVVATIILLALTVVLFASIFAWVTSFPTPAPQSTTQFSANFVLTANQSYVQALQITHLAGPSVSGSTLIYLKSAYHPGAPEFQNPITASVGLPNPTTWNLGQTFNYTFPCPAHACQQPQLPDNITILLVQNDQLIFSTILPGTLIAVPPNFVATSITPAQPAVGAGFSISAVVSGTTNGAPVYVTLSNIPGLSATYPTAQKMTYSAATNRWTFAVPAGDTTANGTYYAFVNITNAAGQTATAGVAITIYSSGGGSSSSTLSVAVVMIPQPPTLPTTSAYFAALVTYLGSGSNLALSVTFWANQTPGSVGMANPWAPHSQTLAGPTGLTITGPSTETVYSSSPSTFSQWLFNSSVLISARGSVATVGGASGSTSFATPNDDQGIVVTAGVTKTFSHTCTTTCPFLNDTVWNNWTSSISYSGVIFVNTTGGTNKATYTVTATTVTAGSFTQFSGPGTKTRWKPTTAYGNCVISTLLVVTSGGVTVGYIYDTYDVDVT